MCAATRFNWAACTPYNRPRQGLTGVVEIVADGAATLRKNAAPLFSTLNANVGARGLALNKKPLGDLTATAETRGKEVAFALNSNFAGSTIKGNGRMELSGDYPIDAQASFANVTYSGLECPARKQPPHLRCFARWAGKRERSPVAHPRTPRRPSGDEARGPLGRRRRGEKAARQAGTAQSGSHRSGARSRPDHHPQRRDHRTVHQLSR